MIFSKRNKSAGSSICTSIMTFFQSQGVRKHRRSFIINAFLVALAAEKILNSGEAALIPLRTHPPFRKLSCFKFSRKFLADFHFHRHSHQSCCSHKSGDDFCKNNQTFSDARKSRRAFLESTAAAISPIVIVFATERDSAGAFTRKKVKEKINPSTAETAMSSITSKVLTVEDSLIQLLPIRNTVFQNLISMINDIIPSVIKEDSSESVSKKCQAALQYLDNYRGKLEPTFDLDDENTMLQIMRNERFEQLLEEFRKNLEAMLHYSGGDGMKSFHGLYPLVKSSKITLSELGEGLVKDFPYQVPTKTKYAALPRLLGRARVTFSLARRTSSSSNSFLKTTVPLGNVTIIADGFAAPLTAGNFVDLSIRNFYTGLPVRNINKLWKKSSQEDQAYTSLAGKLENAVVKLESAAVGKLEETAQDLAVQLGVGGAKDKEANESGSVSSVIPILGSFLDGFIDPLTGKPRRIPLEIVLADQPSNFHYILKGDSTNNGDCVQKHVRPFLTFDIPGLVAMNHPERNCNGGSSEFFSLPLHDIVADRVEEINGQYAPFGYIIEGWDLMQNLDSSVEIESTFVDDWGRQNLVKIKQSSFSDVMNSTSTEDSEA